jgi:hypothetical protein
VAVEMSASTLEYVTLQESEMVAAVLGADPELRSRLGATEAALIDHFGPGTTVERKVDIYEVSEDGPDDLYLRVHTDLSPRQEIDGLSEFLGRHRDLLDPVRGKLFIGFLG